jgi:hypothetical protein
VPENRNPDKENEQADQRLPPVSETIESPPNGNQKHAEAGQQSVREWARFAVEIVTFLVLICYVRATNNKWE